MNFRTWRNWLKSLELWKKWFVYLILLRPILDGFYHYEFPGLGYTPLELVGVVVPFTILFLVFTNQLPNIKTTGIDIIFNAWSAIVIFNCAFVVISFPSIDTLGTILKYSVPGLYLFFTVDVLFVRKEILMESYLLSLCRLFFRLAC